MLGRPRNIHQSLLNSIRDTIIPRNNIFNKMLRKLIALGLVFGVALGEPIPKISSSHDNDLTATTYFVDNNSDRQMARILPDPSLLFDIITTLVGYKFSAVSVAVCVIDWLVSNSLVIIVGAVAALGFCKITDKCSFKLEQFAPVSQLASFVTSEHLETAEKFLVDAVEKYAETKRVVHEPMLSY